MFKTAIEPASQRVRRTGFSFVDMVVVLAITGITSAVAITKFSSAVQRHRVESAARQLAIDLQAAKRSAGSSGKNVIVNFDLINHRYSMVGMKSINRQSSNYAVELSQAPFHCTILSVSLAGQQVTFNRFQQPSLGGSIVLRSGSFSKTVQIHAHSGKVTVQ